MNQSDEERILLKTLYTQAYVKAMQVYIKSTLTPSAHGCNKFCSDLARVSTLDASEYFKLVDSSVLDIKVGDYDKEIDNIECPECHSKFTVLESIRKICTNPTCSQYERIIK